MASNLRMMSSLAGRPWRRADVVVIVDVADIVVVIDIIVDGRGAHRATPQQSLAGRPPSDQPLFSRVAGANLEPIKDAFPLYKGDVDEDSRHDPTDRQPASGRLQHRAGADEAPPPPPMMEPLPADSCGAQAVGSMNGQILDETTRRWIEDRSRADEIRVIQPDEQVTMDHRPGRLDIRVDDQRRILSLACG
ncbi:I78 family peptidase inhibitor [Salinicola tamaricis]|uniref:I78 family peptidase inhibitor n=1 Tax=Salinicola tamaricis TaxID=1771309 RepID=UPI000D09DABB